MNSQMHRLEESIADKIKNYQKHLNNLELNDEHVDRWISQFPEDERIVVLTETDSLLAHNYIRKKSIKRFFDEIWSARDIIGTGSILEINKIQFLNIQREGNSQNRLVSLLEKYYLKKKGIMINRNNHSCTQKYIYLDDCMFTGFRLLKDIDYWLENLNPNSGTQLDIIFIGMYNRNFDYVNEKVKKKCSEKSISINFYWMYSYNNDLKNTLPCDVLWPQYVNDEHVNNYMQEMEQQKRDSG